MSRSKDETIPIRDWTLERDRIFGLTPCWFCFVDPRDGDKSPTNNPISKAVTGKLKGVTISKVFVSNCAITINDSLTFWTTREIEDWWIRFQRDQPVESFDFDLFNLKPCLNN